ncbi:hypothetical protein U6G28_03400 [Actinomycetaceae bacterium MB13-C1-2]|nr:hypothetical protein U6G28_03400 [Actinomycetaceae bacterium MB13-C1-2]
MSIEVNQEAVEFAKKLIAEGKYSTEEDDWGEVNPDTEQQNELIHKEGMGQFAKWHLGVKSGGSRGEKTDYSFPYGDYKVVCRSGLIAAEERAAQYDHFSIRDAAKELLDLLNAAAGE